MITLGFKDHYRVLHLTDEFGMAVIGGVATHCNEQYRYRSPDNGFLHHRIDLDFSSDDYAAMLDTAIITDMDRWRLLDLKFDILVCHYFGLCRFVTQELMKDKKLVYVMHSVPTQEPPLKPPNPPFGDHLDCERSVTTLCANADKIVCVSHAEKRKLAGIFPQYDAKTSVIYNGITMPDHIEVRPPRKQRFGYISRMDYRKGLLETLKVVRDFDVELHIASDVNEKAYSLRRITEYIEASGVGSKLHCHVFCIGPRNRAFYEYCDAVIMSSFYEPFCYVVLEPLAYGKPVIVANNGGSGEIVGPDYRYQFDPYAPRTGPTGFATVFARFLDDPAERIVEETQALITRLPLFSGHRMVDNYQKLLATL